MRLRPGGRRKTRRSRPRSPPPTTPARRHDRRAPRRRRLRTAPPPGRGDAAAGPAAARRQDRGRRRQGRPRRGRARPRSEPRHCAGGRLRAGSGGLRLTDAATGVSAIAGLTPKPAPRSGSTRIAAPKLRQISMRSRLWLPARPAWTAFGIRRSPRTPCHGAIATMTTRKADSTPTVARGAARAAAAASAATRTPSSAAPLSEREMAKTARTTRAAAATLARVPPWDQEGDDGERPGEDRQDGPVEDEGGAAQPERAPPGEVRGEVGENQAAGGGEGAGEKRRCPGRRPAGQDEGEQERAGDRQPEFAERRERQAGNVAPGQGHDGPRRRRGGRRSRAADRGRLRDQPDECPPLPSRKTPTRARSARTPRKTGLERCATAMPTGIRARTVAEALQSGAARASDRRGGGGCGHQHGRTLLHKRLRPRRKATPPRGPAQTAVPRRARLPGRRRAASVRARRSPEEGVRQNGGSDEGYRGIWRGRWRDWRSAGPVAPSAQVQRSSRSWRRRRRAAAGTRPPARCSRR